jgi:hypothetical protein
LLGDRRVVDVVVRIFAVLGDNAPLQRIGLTAEGEGVDPFGLALYDRNQAGILPGLGLGAGCAGGAALTFDDGASAVFPQGGVAPFSGSFRPTGGQSLATTFGDELGTDLTLWRLSLEGATVGQLGGTLQCWSMDITYE